MKIVEKVEIHEGMYVRSIPVDDFNSTIQYYARIHGINIKMGFDGVYRSAEDEYGTFNIETKYDLDESIECEKDVRRYSTTTCGIRMMPTGLSVDEMKYVVNCLNRYTEFAKDMNETFTNTKIIF